MYKFHGFSNLLFGQEEGLWVRREALLLIPSTHCSQTHSGDRPAFYTQLESQKPNQTPSDYMVFPFPDHLHILILLYFVQLPILHILERILNVESQFPFEVLTPGYTR